MTRALYRIPANPGLSNIMAVGIVLFQRNNYGFSGPVVFRSKAQREGNGCPLVKRCNAVRGR